MRITCLVLILGLTFSSAMNGWAAELIGHWPLTENSQDVSSKDQQSVAQHVAFAAPGAMKPPSWAEYSSS